MHYDETHAACRYRFRIGLAAIALACLAVGAVQAQDADLVGLYFDPGYTQQEHHVTAPPEIVTAYLVLKNPSAPGGVAGWECRLNIDGPATLVGTEYAGNVLNVLTPPEFMVGVSTPPLAGDDTVLLATLNLLVESSAPVVLSLLPAWVPSLPGQMVYLDAESLTEILPMFPATGWDVAAWINVSSEPACATSVPELEFAMTSVGAATSRVVTVSNPGITPLEVTPAIADDPGAFTVAGAGQTLTIPALESAALTVTFRPDAVALFESELSLGDPCPPVLLRGESRAPFVAWDMPTELDFGEVLIGTTVREVVRIRNIGEVPFAAVPVLTSGCDDFAILGAGSYPVPVGGSNNIAIDFTPTATGSYECTLGMGDVLPPVTLLGTGRAPETTWVAPTALDFGDVDTGQSVTLPLVVTNTGEVALYLAFFLDPACEAFTFLGPANVTLQPGQSSSTLVLFEPLGLGEFACELDLGPIVPPVTLTGTSTTEIRAHVVVPGSLELPPTPAGLVRSAAARITNTGNIAFDLDPELGAGAPEFTIASGGEPGTLEPLESRTVVVEFAPATAGEYFSTLDFGEDLSTLPVSGTALPAGDVCRIDQQVLEFGQVPFTSSRTLQFTVTNLGDEILALDPVSSLPEFLVPHGPIYVAPGEGRVIAVTFDPVAVGPLEAVIALGEDACGDVTCRADAVELPPVGANTVGLFFDPDFTMFETTGTPYQPFELYLALLECSSPAGVGAWECRVTTDGGTCFFLEAVLAGQAINILTAPDFMVGVATPLPPSGAGILLATLRWLSLSFEPVFFRLGPTDLPSIPGEMAWVEGGSDQIWPMYTTTGMDLVAIWNGGGLVAVDAPPPALGVQGARVTISWQQPAAAFDAVQVLRRRGQQAPVAVSGPLPAAATLSFTDDIGDCTPGEVLYYSYSLFQSGRETSRSGEVQITVPALPALATQLLPNVPNPFNPRTEIRFQMERSGPARVLIFDVQGRKVCTLVDENLAAGPQSRTWFGRDDGGRQAPSGAYYVRLETEAKTDTRKIMLLK